MKFFFLFSFCYLISLTNLFSQKDYNVIIGEEKRLQITRMMGEVFNFSEDQFFCEKYLPNFQIINFENLSVSSSQEIPIKGKINEIIFIAYMDETFQIIRSNAIVRKEFKLYSQAIDTKNLNYGEMIELNTFDHSAKITNEFRYVNFSVSDDKSKLAILHTKANDKTHKISHLTSVYDNEMNLLWEKSTSHDNYDDLNYYRNDGFVVGNMGQTCNVWMQSDVVGFGEKVEFIDGNGDLVNNFELGKKSYTFSTWNQLKLEKDKFLISSICFDRKVGQNGILFAEIDGTSGNLTNTTYSNLLNSFDDFNFSIKKLHVLDDGKVFIVAENWERHHTDLLVLLFDEKKELIWSERIKKNQMTLDNDLYMASFFSAIRNNELFLFFTDHPDNINVVNIGSSKLVTPQTKTIVSLVRISCDKKITKEHYSKIGCRLNKSLCFQENNDSPILINIRKGFKYRFDKIY